MPPNPFTDTHPDYPEVTDLPLEAAELLEAGQSSVARHPQHENVESAARYSDL